MSKQDTNACCAPLSQVLSPALFKALSDPRRVAILTDLAEGCMPRTVSDVAACCTIDLSVVSRHLAMLRDAGILAAEKRGKQVYYSVQTDVLAAALRQIADSLEACCPVPEEESLLPVPRSP